MENSAHLNNGRDMDVLGQLQNDHDPKASLKDVQELLEMSEALDNEALLGVCYEAETLLRNRRLELELEPTPELEMSVCKLELTVRRLYLLIDMMPFIDRARAIALYKIALDPELGHCAHIGEHVSMQLDSLGISEDTATVWRHAFSSRSNTNTAIYAIEMYETIMKEQGLKPSDIPSAINQDYRISRRQYPQSL